MKNFLVHNDDVIKKMCTEIGVSDVRDLFKQIPEKARMQSLELPDAISEMETQKRIKSLAKKNKSDFISFKGGGVYNKFVPACVSQVAQLSI